MTYASSDGAGVPSGACMQYLYAARTPIECGRVVDAAAQFDAKMARALEAKAKLQERVKRFSPDSVTGDCAASSGTSVWRMSQAASHRGYNDFQRLADLISRARKKT